MYNIYVSLSLSPCCSIIDSQTLYWVMSPKGETAETALAQYSHFMRQEPSFQAFYLGLPRNRVETRIAIQKENKSGWEPLDFWVPRCFDPYQQRCRSSQYEYHPIPSNCWVSFHFSTSEQCSKPWVVPLILALHIIINNEEGYWTLLKWIEHQLCQHWVGSKYVQNSG